MIDQQRTILADVDYLDLEDIAKVIENFGYPKLPEKKKEKNLMKRQNPQKTTTFTRLSTVKVVMTRPLAPNSMARSG